MTGALLAPDARVGAGEWNGRMDSFDTWQLVIAPLLGVVIVAATLLARLFA